MKNRPTWTARSADPRRRAFAFHPLSVAICLGFSGVALAAPQGGNVVAGQATITQQTPTSQVINQTTNKAIIDWRSFSIASGEKVRFNQPSTTSVTLNRVTGYDPSHILGEMSANGKIFLVNPYGVVFGANARVDVGGLVATSLSLANSDFLASRYSLTSVDSSAPATRGEVRNEGTISAPGGTVVLAAPSVSNTGTIVANGGRVGMVAANAVSIDVEGDGLLFFQTSATEAKNRLEQLGRIQADGGSIEMRAAARGAFADTVLNMAGIVQARSIGSRDGKIVIDGGGEGIVAVSGRLDASAPGAGERGGAVTVEGQKVLIDRGASIDVSGDAGGGRIRVGGDFHGANPEVRNAEETIVMPGSEMRADALARGDGGTVVVWADGSTTFNGSISARGGPLGGNGGSVETSGKDGLSIAVGHVTASAAAGNPGTWLLDPTNIVVALAGAATIADVATFGANPGTTQTIAPATLDGAGTSVVLQAVRDITFSSPVTLNTVGADLTAQAGRSILVNSSITTTSGAITLRAVDPASGAADATGVLNVAAPLNSNGATVTLQTAGTAGISLGAAVTARQLDLTTANAPVTQSAGALTVTTTTNISAGTGSVSLTTAGNSLTAAVSSSGTGTVTLVNNIATQLGAIGAAGNPAASLSVTTSNDAVTQTAAAFVAGATTVAAGTGAVTLSNAGNQLAGAVSSTGTGAVTVVNTVATQLGAIGASLTPAASLSVTTSDDAVTQSADAFVAGATTVNAGTADITLSRAGNDFQGNVSLTGGALSVADTNNLTITTLVNGSNKSVTAIAGGTLALPAAPINASAGNLDLRSGTALTTPGVLTGQNVTLIGGGGVNLANNVTASVSLSLGSSDAAIAQSGGSVLTVTGTTTAAAGTGAVTLDTAGNQLGNSVSSTGTGAVTIVNSVATQLGAIGASGNPAASLNVSTSNDVVSQTAAAFVSGSTTVAAGSAAVTLDSASNELAGAVSSTGTGAVTLVNTVATQLGAMGASGNPVASLSVSTSNDAVSQTAAAFVNGATTVAAGSGAVTLDAASNQLNGSVSSTGTGAVTIVNTIATQLGAIGASGNSAASLSVTTSNDAVTQGADAFVAGATTVAAGTAAVTLDAAGNQLAGAVSSTGTGAVTVVNTVATQLGAIGASLNPATSLSVTTSNDAVTQSADAFVANATTVNAGSADITLSRAGNDFQGNVSLTGGALSVADTNNLDITTLVNNGNKSVIAIAGGTLNLPNVDIDASAGDIDLRSLGGALSTRDLTAQDVTLVSSSALNLSRTITATGNLSLQTSNTAIAQSGSGDLIVTGTTTAAAGTGAVTLDSTGNQLTGAVSSTGTGAVTLRNTLATQLGAIGASGSPAASLSVTTTPDLAVTQTADAFVAGATTVNAGTGDITLSRAGNDFQGNVSLTGGALSVVDANNLTVTTLASTGNKSITAIAGGTLALPAVAINAGSGNIDLQSLGGSLTTPGTLTAQDITLVGSGGVNLANNVTATGNLSLGSSNNTIAQSGGSVLTVTNTTTAAAGTGAVTLNTAGNQLTGPVGSTGTGAVTIVNSIATQLGAIGASGNPAASLSVTTSNDAVTQTADAFVAGATTVNAGTADITLSRPGNDFQGNVSLTGGALSVADANNLAIATLASSGNKSITAIAGGTLNLPATAINAGAGDIDLRSLGGSLATPGNLTAANVFLTGATGLTIANTVSATNVSLTTSNAAITEPAGGTISATGTTTFATGSGAVTLGQNNSLNSIGGTAGTVSISEASANGVVLGATAATNLTIDVTGGALAAVTQSAPLVVSGTTTINTSGGAAVTLTGPGNNFGTFAASAAGSAVNVADSNAIILGAITAGSLGVDTSAGNGAVTQSAPLAVAGATTINAGSGPIILNLGNALSSFGATGGAIALTENSGAIALDDIVASSLAVNTSAVNGNVTQSPGRTLTVSGPTSVDAGTGAINLGNAGNDLGSFGAIGGAVTVRNDSALVLDAIDAASLGVDTSAGNGALTQSAPVIVSGSTTVNTGSGAIVLNDPANDFSNAPGNTFTGGAIDLRDINDLRAAVTNAPNQSVSVIAAGGLTLAGGVNTGSADLTLSSGLVLATPGTLIGNNITLTGTGGVSIDNNVTATNNLALNSTDSAINQTAGSIVSGGTTTVTAGTGAVSLARPLNDFNNVNVASGGTVTINDANALTAAANASGDLTITSTGLLGTGGPLSGVNIDLTGNAGINLGHNVNAAGTLTLTSTNAAINQTAGSILVPLQKTTVDAGTGDVTLNQPGNDFNNSLALGISVTGGAVRLQDTNDLFVSSLTNGANKDLSLTAGNAINGVSGNIDTGSADLSITAGAGFTTFGTLRGTNVTIGGGTVGVSIGDNVTALGNLTLNATNSPIAQTAGTISAAGTTTATAGTGPISLALAGNNFATFAASGSTVNVRDDNGLALGAISTNTLTLDSSAGNGGITQSGAAIVGGTTTITAGTGAVSLSNPGNDFASIGVAGGAVSITDLNALALNAVSASSLTINTSANNGNVTQNAAATVTGATSVNAGTGTVSLVAGNDFASVGVTGGTVTINDVNALALGATNAGSLLVTAGGPVSQVGAVVVSGGTTVDAGGNAITLGNPGNDFASIAATGGAITIADSNALALDAISATSLTLSAGNAAITQNAAATVSGATIANAGTGAVTLSNPGNNFGSVAATGGAVSVTDVDALTLGAVNATSLTVNTASGNGPVTQSGAAIVSGASTLNAGTGAVSLSNPGNDFATLGVTGGAISVVDTSALTLSALSSAPNQSVSIVAGGTLTLPATAIDTGSAALTLTSGGPLATTNSLRGTNVALTSAGAMTLGGNVTSLGTLDLTTANAPITQNAGTSVVAAGTATVNAGSGDITLNQSTNNFQGNLLLTGGAIDVADVDNLAVTQLVSGPNKPVTLVAGGSLSLPNSPIDTGTADLRLQALGGTLVISGPLSGNTVTLTGTAGLTLGADITSSGDQIYTTQVQLAGPVTLDAGASKIDLQGGANGAGNNLALKSSNAAADAIHTGAAVVNTNQFTVTGNSTLGGNVATTGNQTYTGPVTLGTNVTLDSGAAKIDLQSSLDAAGNTLALTSGNAAADAIRAAGVVSNAAQLTVTGKSSFLTGVTTTGAQLYSDTVTLGSNANFVGSSLGFGNGIVAGSFDLGLRSDTLNLAGTVSGSGNATLSSLTQNATVGVAGGAGSYQVGQATLDKFSSFASITVGRADGTGDLTFGNLVLPTNFAVLSAAGDVAFTGTVASAAGQGRNLAVTTGGTTTFGGAVGGAIGGSAALGNLSVANATQLDASTTANGTVSLGGPVTVGADATVSASAITLGSTLDVGTNALTLLSDALSVAGPASGSGAGSVRIAPKDAAGSMGVGGGAGALQVSQGLIDTMAGVPTLTLGRNDSTGTITAGTLTLPTDLAIDNGSGAVVFTGSVDSAAGPARDLTVTTAGLTAFGGTVGTTRALDALSVSGGSQFGANIVTTGAQTYGGAASLVGDSTLTGASVGFGSTVDGARALSVNAAATNFTGAVGGTTALTSLTTDAAGTTQLGGNVTTTGSQTYNDALQLNGNAVLAGSTLTLAGSVNGARTLAVNGSTGVTLGGPIGTGTALTGLSVSGPLQLSAGSVTTTGVQTYAGATTLGAATTLTAPSIAFGSTLNGGFALTTQSAGPTSFAGAVGATTPLAALTANGGGAVQLAGPSIDTTGAQSYSGALQLTGNSRLTGSALTLTGPVSGAADLTLQTNALVGGTAIAGTGVLTIAPIDPALTIGVAGGTGTLQVGQAVVDGASGFASHVIGRTDGTGTLTAGNMLLRANTTLQSATGDLNVGSVDGAFALALNSGGTTRITGPIGAATPLASLTTDNNAAAADWDGTAGERTAFDTADGTGAARVITSGAQTFDDPVTASVPVAFSGGAITATHAANRFDGAFSANAISLDLHSSTDLRLGSLTLVNGGSIETDGVLHIAGTVQLNGGVLTLTSNATPTPIDLTDAEYAGQTLSFGFVPIKEASATIVQDAGSSVGTATGSMLVLRAPTGGSILLEQPGNTLLGQVSAVSGALGDNDTTRFTTATTELTLGFLRIVSSEIHVAGRPPGNGDQTLQQAGLESDVIKLTADVLTTGPDGLIRARLPFNNIQGSQTSLPGLTLAMTPTALSTGGGFGGPESDTFIQVQVGASEGGFLTARPKGTSGDTAVIFLGGDASVTPFYDGAGKLNEIRIFYNGNAPRTPQETGALAAVIALIEDARQARFEEAVRTENVRSRLRSGVIAEVGAGRPATVGRESIRLPDTCEIKPKTLLCE